MATIGNKNVCSARAGRLHALHEVAISAGLSLTFRPRRRLTRATSRKDVLFDPPTGPQMPEANARQRCAPSGAKLFGISLILRSRESGVSKDEARGSGNPSRRRLAPAAQGEAAGRRECSTICRKSLVAFSIG